MSSDLTTELIGAFRWNDPGHDFPHLVSDLSGWWRSPSILHALGPALAGLFVAEQPTVVVAPEVTGFVVGPLVAIALEVGFVEAYKGGHAPVAEPMTWAQAAPDHKGRRLSLGVRTRQLRPGDRALIVDDWITTGAQSRALGEIVTACGAVPVGTAAIVAECTPEVAAELRVRSILRAEQL
ncbi:MULTISPECIES: phosphoribosyltransferase family protein [Catenuloplanes]|uniref:Adenine phosphoribosyltransferase n=1 Tax=Catenuloplanes niger TaxID=587534 RepID=A0AAE3ZQF1_9ACTN|nr:phosphoribosyltransferase family protein [Catenuloplanes niger]MDR7323656.1 adenine phosphoribosyltransferase [Catenuloplanes niger]